MFGGQPFNNGSDKNPIKNDLTNSMNFDICVANSAKTCSQDIEGDINNLADSVKFTITFYKNDLKTALGSISIQGDKKPPKK